MIWVPGPGQRCRGCTHGRPIGDDRYVCTIRAHVMDGAGWCHHWEGLTLGERVLRVWDWLVAKVLR